MLDKYLDDRRYGFRLAYCRVEFNQDLDNVISRDWSIRVMDGCGIVVAEFQIWEDLKDGTLKLTRGGFHVPIESPRTAELLERVKGNGCKNKIGS
jgi:hypothetical protein